MKFINILKVLTIFLLVYSCEKAGPDYKTKEFIIRERYDPIKLIEIDSCEYLFGPWGNSSVLTHKGNCKFCKLRKETGK